MPDDVGISIPQDVSLLGDADSLREFVLAAENEGYSSLWVAESTEPNVLDPLAVLNFAAAITSRPKLGMAVLLSSLRAPLRLAREVSSLDRLSDGRCLAGIGLGNDRAQYGRYGLSPSSRAARFEAGARMLRQLLTEERVSSNGRWWQLVDEPRPLDPVQDPPPLFFGARRPAALERAARLGDGWIGAGSMADSDFRVALQCIRGHLDSLGRRSSDFTIAKRVYIHVGDDGPSTHAALERWFGHHYRRPQLASEVAVVGEAADCARYLNDLVSLGVSSLILHPVLDVSEQMRRLAHEVVPRLH